MFTDTTSFRPRNGEPAEAYWRVRLWCLKYGFTFSDVLNGIMIPLAFHLENFCELDKAKGIAYLDLTVGEVPLLHVFQGKMYPLRKDVDPSKDHLTLENVKERIAHWTEKNTNRPTVVDKFLKKLVLKPKVKAPKK